MQVNDKKQGRNQLERIGREGPDQLKRMTNVRDLINAKAFTGYF